MNHLAWAVKFPPKKCYITLDSMNRAPKLVNNSFIMESYNLMVDSEHDIARYE